jgi:hypothetical protein
LFEGHSNPLNGEGEHNKTADCNHSGLNSVEMMTDNGPICNNQPLERGNSSRQPTNFAHTCRFGV